MSTQAPGLTYAECCGEAYRTAMSAWRDLYAKNTRLQDLLASEIVSATLTATSMRGGRLFVTVELSARKPWDSEVYPFAFYQQGNNRYLPNRGTNVKP